MKHIQKLVTTLLLVPFAIAAEVRPAQPADPEPVTVRPVLVETNGGQRIEYLSGSLQVGRSTDAAPAGVELKLPGAEWAPVQFQVTTERDGGIELGPEKIGPLTFRWRLVQKTPSLVERTLQVSADAAQRFTVAFPLDVAVTGEMASFSGPVTNRVVCDTVRGAERTETFPAGDGADGRAGVGDRRGFPGSVGEPLSGAVGSTSSPAGGPDG